MGDMGQLEEVSNNMFKSLIREQFKSLDSSLLLGIADKVRPLLIPQTVYGRALMGHGSFKGASRPDISMPEVIEAIGLDSAKIRYERQVMMQDFLSCIDDLIDGKKKKLTNRKGEAIYGVNFLQDFELEVDRDFFKGGALVGRMDLPYWRQQTVKSNPMNLKGKPLRIGCGEELPINLEKLRELNLTVNDLSTKPHNFGTRSHLRKVGLIVAGDNLTNELFENHFMRYAEGCGVCDDAALVSIGLIYGQHAMVLGFGVDGTDTYTKFCENTVSGGFDEHIGRHIERRWKEKYHEKLLSARETTELIYLAAKNTLKLPFSSSHRRLVEHERIPQGGTYDKPTILHHLDYVVQGTKSPFDMGFERFPSKEFYRNIEKRFKKTGNSHLIPRR